MADTAPKVFISYSWSSTTHCEHIRDYAQRLVNDGVDVILDQWDLSEGQDKYAFMEKMDGWPGPRVRVFEANYGDGPAGSERSDNLRG